MVEAFIEAAASDPEMIMNCMSTAKNALNFFGHKDERKLSAVVKNNSKHTLTFVD